MQAACPLFLALTCVIGAFAPLLTMAQKTEEFWRLEMGPYRAPAHRRIRRQAFPGGSPCLTVDFLTDMKDRFSEHIDKDDDGKATAKEVQQYLKNFNPAITDMQVTSFIRRRDLNGNGLIEFIPEYVLDIATPDMTPEAAGEWFSIEDANRDGHVSRRELMRIAQQLGMTTEQADDKVSSYYMSVDTDGDDKLSFDEYKVLYGQ